MIVKDGVEPSTQPCHYEARKKKQCKIDVYRLRRLFIYLMSMCHSQSLIFKNVRLIDSEQLPIKNNRIIFAMLLFPIVVNDAYAKRKKQNRQQQVTKTRCTKTDTRNVVCRNALRFMMHRFVHLASFRHLRSNRPCIHSQLKCWCHTSRKKNTTLF